MTQSSVPPQYEDVIMCEAPQHEDIIHIKVVALPYGDPVEFNTTEARAFAKKILVAVEKIEGKWRAE